MFCASFIAARLTNAIVMAFPAPTMAKMVWQPLIFVETDMHGVVIDLCHDASFSSMFVFVFVSGLESVLSIGGGDAVVQICAVSPFLCVNGLDLYLCFGFVIGIGVSAIVRLFTQESFLK
ncbi:MAG: hypothetical protein GY938_04940, partial [Ketobacter sp.]|nr:hypothetical protein [Ketobacter sp.]